MSTKIIIERRCREAVTSEDLRIIDEIRMKALRNRGYIGGETIVNAEDPHEVIVISAWSNAGDWKAWYENLEWKGLEKELTSRLERSANVRIFVAGAEYAKSLNESMPLPQGSTRGSRSLPLQNPRLGLEGNSRPN